MTSKQMTLLTGSRQIADEGMVAWLLMRLSGLAFEHRFADSGSPDMAELVVDGENIVNSVGIAAFIGELVPAIWPQDSRARAHARSIAAEAFGQMQDFKTYMPMAITEQFMPSARLLRRTSSDLDRLSQRWNKFLALNHGHFLFGEFAAADAFQAPLAARCVTYGLEIDKDCEAYVDAIMSFPLVAEWQSMAADNSRATVQFAGLALDTLVATAPVSRNTEIAPTEAPMPLTEPKPEPEPEIATASAETAKEMTDLDETLPFRVDIEDKRTLETTIPPVIIRPREGKGLFQRKNRRVLTNPYRSASVDTVVETPETAERVDTLDERPTRSIGIKPIGGGIRRRR